MRHLLRVAAAASGGRREGLVPRSNRPDAPGPAAGARRVRKLRRDLRCVIPNAEERLASGTQQGRCAASRAYPVQLDERADAVLVTFPDIPGALTEGATVEEALAESADCLIAALGGYGPCPRGGGRAIPVPSSAVGGETVELPPVVGAKLALYEAARAERLDEREMAVRLGCSTGAVRVLLDIDSETPLARLQGAMRAIGERRPAQA